MSRTPGMRARKMGTNKAQSLSSIRYSRPTPAQPDLILLAGRMVLESFSCGQELGFPLLNSSPDGSRR